MRNVYLSFLGLGMYNPETKKSEYRPAVYDLDGEKSKKTEFVQAAEIELLGKIGIMFDEVFIAATTTSRDNHFDSLNLQLKDFGITPSLIIISEDMTSRDQWKWFESILARIEPFDMITVDLTHGFRASPVIFSAAINFLQKARNISLQGVYYGAFEKARELGYAPIVDMKDFYNINEWADGVSRLVEDADARKLAETAEKTSEFQIGELNDVDVIQTLENLTNTIRNVDVNNVNKKASAALELIEKKKESASITGRLLLDLVIQKFTNLATQPSPSGKYDRSYFKIQIEITRLLLKHKLYMQAYTVMREFIASLVMIYFEEQGVNRKERKKKRPWYGEIFVNMLKYEEKEWNFPGKQAELAKLKPYYSRLKEIGVESIIREFSMDLIKYRNGFDHAWTAMPEAYEDIREKGDDFFQKLQDVLNLLEQNNLV